MASGALTGKTALITGGGNGIGRAIAIKLARAGAAVTITGRFSETEDPIPYQTGSDKDETIALVEAVGGKCLAVKADVRSIDEMENAVTKTIEAFGGLDIVVANAGIFSGGIPCHQLDEGQWDLMMDVTVKGAWHTARAAIPQLLKSGGGSIVLMSSVAGIKGGNPGFSHYVTAKHAITGLSRSLATEYGPSNIRVNIVAPTSVETPMSQNQFYYDLFSGGSGGTKEQMDAVIASMHSLPVAGIQPEDVANAVGWLVSEEARYVHGIVLPVDAGSSMY